MFKGSIHSLYDFKEPLRHISYRSIKFFEFNSFIDPFDGNYFNSSNMSLYSWYPMCQDELDKTYISSSIICMCG